MNITLGMLIDRIGEYSPCATRPEYLDKEFRSLRLLPQSPKELKTDAVVYITDKFWLDETRKMLLQFDGSEDLCIIYVRSADSPAMEYSCVDLYTETELSVVMNSMQELLDMLRSWEDNINMEIIRSGNVQAMLDLCEEIFSFPIAVYDPSLKLMAATKDKTTDDLLFRELVDNQTVTEDMAFRLAELNYIPTYQKAVPVRIFGPDELSDYEKVFLSVEVNGRSCAIMYAPISEKDTTNATIVLLKFLSEKLALALASSTTLEMANRLEYEYLIQDLLSGKEVDEQSVRARAEYLKMPAESHFVLLRVDVPEVDTIPAEYLRMRMRSIHPSAKVMQYQRDILILLSYPKKEKVSERVSESIQALRPVLKKNEITCGVSMYFSSLLDISQAYLQASSAAAIGKRLLNSHFVQEFSLPAQVVDPYVFQFGCLTSYYAYYHCAQNMDYRVLCVPELMDLIRLTRQAKSNHVRILFAFLTCNCRLTDTASVLFMHRNNIVYHIRRIEEMMQMDFNDYETRLRLMQSFEVLMLCDEGEE